MTKIACALLTSWLALSVPSPVAGFNTTLTAAAPSPAAPPAEGQPVLTDVVIKFPDPRANRATYRNDRPETYPYGHEYVIFAELGRLSSSPGEGVTLEGVASDGLLVVPFRPAASVPAQGARANVQGCGGYVRDECRSRERWATLETGERTYLLEVGSHTKFEPAGLDLGDGFWQLTPGRTYQVAGDILHGRMVGGLGFDSLIRVHRLKMESAACRSRVLIVDPRRD